MASLICREMRTVVADTCDAESDITEQGKATVIYISHAMLACHTRPPCTEIPFVFPFWQSLKISFVRYLY